MEPSTEWSPADDFREADHLDASARAHERLIVGCSPAQPAPACSRSASLRVRPELGCPLSHTGIEW
jgi:hypothetical protein